MIDKDNYNDYNKNNQSPNWIALNTLGRQYVEHVKQCDAAHKRCLSMQDQQLLRMGLLKKVMVSAEKKEKVTRKLDDGTQVLNIKERDLFPTKKGIGYKLVPVDDSPEIAAKIEHERDVIKETREYDLMYQQFVALEKQKNELKKQCKELFPPTIWGYCDSVKGMKEIACMTFCGFINPQQKIKLDDGVTDSDKYITIANVKAHFGVTPGSRLKKGQQGNFSPLMKGRLLGVVIPGVIRAVDPYYKPLFDIKKQYYRERPDLKHELECDGKCGITKEHNSYNHVENKGWKATVNSLAERWLGSVVLSHAFECMCMDDPIRRDDPFVINHHERHRDPIPIKPRENIEEWRNIQHKVANYHERLLAEQQKIWDADDTPDKRRYFAFLQNNHFT